MMSVKRMRSKPSSMELAEECWDEQVCEALLF